MLFVFRPLTDLFHVVLGGENEPNLRQRLAQQDVRVAQLHDELVGADGVKPRIDKLEEHVALIASHDRLQVDAALAAYTREQQRKQRRRGNG